MYLIQKHLVDVKKYPSWNTNCTKHVIEQHESSMMPTLQKVDAYVKKKCTEKTDGSEGKCSQLVSPCIHLHPLPSIQLPIYPPTYPSTQSSSIHPSTYPSTHLPLWLSTATPPHQPICSSIHPPTHMHSFIHSSIHSSILLPTHSSICPFISSYPSILLSFHPFIYILSTDLSMHVSTHLTHPPVHLYLIYPVFHFYVYI